MAISGRQPTQVKDFDSRNSRHMVGERKSLIPLNKRLWDIVVIQARAKYHTWPSPTASKWAHDKYRQLGGRFRVAGEETPDERKDRREKEKEQDRKKTQKEKEDDKKKKHEGAKKKNLTRNYEKK